MPRPSRRAAAELSVRYRVYGRSAESAQTLLEAAGAEPRTREILRKSSDPNRSRSPKLAPVPNQQDRNVRVEKELELVEAAGVEPASESTSPQDSTCVSASEISCPA